MGAVLVLIILLSFHYLYYYFASSLDRSLRGVNLPYGLEITLLQYERNGK